MNERQPSIDNIIRMVEATFGVSRVDLLSRRRDHHVVVARHAGMWLARRLTKNSLPQIGARFDRDHTSVLYGISRMDAMLESDPTIGQTVLGLMDALTLPPEAA